MKQKEIKLRILINEYKKLKQELENHNSNIDQKTYKKANNSAIILLIISIIIAIQSISNEEYGYLMASFSSAFIGVIIKSCCKDINITEEGYTLEEAEEIIITKLHNIENLKEEIVNDKNINYESTKQKVRK